MNKAYSRINWQNQPSTSTALGATNLNKMDIALNTIDDRVMTLDTTKLDLTTANSMVKSFSLDQSTGVIKITLLDGTVTNYDTKLEKLAVNFAYDATAQQLVITLDDGTKQYVDMSALITQYEFKDSSTVGFTVDASGKVSASVKNGSITADKLQPNYLADITAQQQTATAQAKLAKRYAVGGVEAGDTTDNAKYYKEQAELFKTQAKQYRDEAQDISNVGIAGESKLGLVKGDGNVEIESDGDMWADPYKDKGTVTGTFINFKSADDAMAQVNIKGATTVVPTNPDLPISPDNKATLVSAQNFDLVSSGDNIFDIVKYVGDGSQLVYATGMTLYGNGGLQLTCAIGSSPYTNGIVYNSGETVPTPMRRYCLKVKPNTMYKLSYTSTENVICYINYLDSDYKVLPDQTNPYRQVTTGFTTPSNAFYIAFRIGFINATTTNPTVTDIKLELGSVATPYTPYKEDRINIPYPMRSLPNGVCDKIKENIYQPNIKIISLTGNEAFGRHAIGVSGKYRFAIPIDDAVKSPNDNYTGNILCSHFTNISPVKTHSGSSDGITVNISNTLPTGIVYIYIENLSTTTVEAFKTFVKEQYDKGTPITILYHAYNLTSTPLNTYLKTFKGTTNIFTTANPQVELTATFKSQLWADSYLKEKAIESKIDDKKRVNNLLSTDPTTVLSGPMGKLLQENIDAISTNLNKQTDVLADCNNPTALTCFCNGTTLNTPYKQGLTTSSEGRLFSIRSSGSWNQELFLVNGGNEIFLRYVTDGTWATWESLNNNLSWTSGKYVAVDLNNYVKVGIYIYNGWDSTLLNRPVINKWGTLIVSNIGTTVSHTLITEDAVVYTRKYETSGGWEPWKNNDSNTVNAMTINSPYGNIVSGGYVKNGRMVTLNFRVNITSEMPSFQGHIGGIPNAITDFVPLSCMDSGGVSINGVFAVGTGVMRNINLPVGEYIISGSYISLN